MSLPLLITDLPVLTGTDVAVATDVIPIVDVSNGPNGKASKITVQELIANTSSFVQSGIGPRPRTSQDKMRDIVSILDWVEGDGSDESIDAQAAIDAVSLAGGGELWVPNSVDVTCNVTLKDGVVIRGPRMNHVPWTTTGGRFIAAAAGAVIDTPVAATVSCGVVGLGIQGLGAGTACKGIHFRDVARGQVKSVTFNNFSDEAVLEDSGSIACVYEDLFAQNCLLDRTQAAKIGVFDFGGTDQLVERIEGTASVSALSDANAYLCGVLIRGANGFYSKVIGEISDEGIHLTSTATLNRLTACRADLNFGHGFNILGSANQFDICLSLSNSQETTNTYDNWLVSGTSNVMNGPISHFVGAKAPRYHFNDTAGASDSLKNYWNAPIVVGGIASSTAAFNNTTSAWQFPSGTPQTLTANSATPRIDSFGGYGYFTTANTNPTTLTNLGGGVNGQEIVLIVGDSNTTVQHNGASDGFVTPNTGDVKLRTGVHYRLRKSGAWRFADDQVLFANNVSADNGDAAKSIQTRISEPTQVWNTPLGADRAVTLSTTGAYAGAKFRIVRTAAATGGFNLNVGTGPLKAMGTAGSFCDVEYNGSAWMLTAYGVL